MTSIRDIAKMAGVSAASVSRILNNDQDFSINENTRKRVIEIANSVNYTKDKNKHGVRSTGDELTIGLIVRHSEASESDDLYFRSIRRGIETEAAKWRMRVVRAFHMRDRNKDWSQLSRYGAVIMIGEMTEDAIQQIYELNNNLIIVDGYGKYEYLDVVQTDFTTKTNELMDVLYEHGHRNIAFVGGLGNKIDYAGEPVPYYHEVREISYREWMKLHNLETHINVNQGPWSTATGLKLGTEILAKPNRPTAIMVASDPMAVGVYRAINDAGLKIPEDISVVSFDDLEMSKYMVPSLSSTRINSEEMGSIAVKQAKDRILNGPGMSIRIICVSEFEQRDSIGDNEYDKK